MLLNMELVVRRAPIVAATGAHSVDETCSTLSAMLEAETRTPQQPAEYPQLGDLGLRMRGVTAGAVVFAGVAVANIANAGFNLVAGRWLGPRRYSDVAALLAVLGLVSFPLGAAQFNIASWVASLAARGDARSVAALCRRALLLALSVGAAVAVLLVLASIPIRDVLGVRSLTAVVLLALAAIPAAATPPVLGLAQGLERFVLFSWGQAAGPVIRLVLLPVALGVGAGVAGAMGATFVGSTLGIAAAAIALRGWFLAPSAPSPIAARSALGAIWPVTIGIVSLTSLSSIDVVVAKLAFPSRVAGVYGGASLMARLILYVPAAIATVLLPKVASRRASGRPSTDIVFKSIVATGAVCCVAVAVYAAAPTLLLRAAYGSEYVAAQSYLWLFGLVMTGFALVNVLFVYHIARDTRWVPLTLGGAALVQIALFALLHSSPKVLLAVSLAVAYSLLALLVAVTWRARAASALTSARG
jgi:O-antigen/teichoic acid export membrane protein